jgi:serine/threonine-protein kinase HipA
VVETEFHELADGEDSEQPYLLITRYDREIAEDGRRRRIHQEDMAQALGLPSSLKYQRDGGPSLGEIVELVRSHAARPVEAVARIRDWQIFNVLVGNWDGHAKNLAFLHRSGEGVGLAPFYDLVSIELFNLLRPKSFSRDLAFSVGTAIAPERIQKADWQAFAKAMGMPASRMLARVTELAERLPGIAEETVAAFQEAHRKIAVADRLVETVRKRCRWTLDTLA